MDTFNNLWSDFKKNQSYENIFYHLYKLKIMIDFICNLVKFSSLY